MGIVDETLTDRRFKVVWKVLTGFNTNGMHNKVLHKILLNYIYIRTGQPNYRLDQGEFGAAAYAVQLYYLKVVTDNKTIGKGSWTACTS